MQKKVKKNQNLNFKKKLNLICQRKKCLPTIQQVSQLNL